MNQLFGNLLLVSTFVLVMTSVASSTDATDLIPISQDSRQYLTSSSVELSLDTDSTSQVTSVSQLSDVQPTVLEARTAQLEANQFSTTTQLEGSAIFAISDAFGEQAGDGNNTVFQQRLRLYFNTSFTGKDRLRTRIDFGNFEQFDLPTVFPIQMQA